MTGNGIRIGKLFGIEIRVDWSWIFILLLVTWDLEYELPSFNPQWSTGFTWFLAVIGALLFFGSVLLHELAHSIVAKAKGLEVSNITLFLFGGVSNIQREPRSARDEFQITIVGPLTSIMLGVIFYVIASASYHQILHPIRGFTGVSATSAVSIWLGYINIILGIFNLIPAFPMDGGRILRSIIWATTGNLRVATRWASWVGQGIGWIFVVGGIFVSLGGSVPFFGTGFIGGLWLIFIGWFLRSAAQSSYQQLVVHDLLEGVRVRALMKSDPTWVQPATTIGTLVHDFMMQSGESAFAVIRLGEFVGLVTLEDVRKVPRDQWEQTTVESVMTPREQLESVSADDDASEAFEKLARRQVNQVPVVENNDLIGMLRVQDVMRWLQLHKETARG